MPTLEQFKNARSVLKGVIRETSLIDSPALSKGCGNRVYLKPENMQVTGAYKIRGAYYKISTLTQEQRERGLVTASAGNHAQGVAYAAQAAGVPATIVMPTTTPLVKVNNTKDYGAKVILHGEVFDESAELAAKQLESVKDQFTRLTAEYDNYRKRTTKEKEGLYQDAKADTIREFLAVYDNLERAAASEGGEDSPHKKGLEMIFAQYKEILKKLGVTQIEALGQPFDPEKHNAVMHIDDESLGENVVSQVFQEGFSMGDKVIRHAIVQVAN